MRKALSDGKRLTPRNRIFIELICDGVPIVEAHKKAGYSGKAGAAYELKSSLKYEIAKALEARGFSREGLATEILKLSQLPLSDVYKSGISFNQKLALLRLLNSALPKEEEKKINNLTVLNFSKTDDGKLKVEQNSNVIDITNG